MLMDAGAGVIPGANASSPFFFVLDDTGASLVAFVNHAGVVAGTDTSSPPFFALDDMEALVVPDSVVAATAASSPPFFALFCLF